MSKRHWLQFLGLNALLGTFAGAAAALPLTYTVVAAESNIFVRDRLRSTVDVSPDYTETLGTNQFPISDSFQGSSNTQPSPLSRAIADVGLPGSFNDGANGITFSTLVIHTFGAPGTIAGSSAIQVPVSVTGPSLLVSITAAVTSLQITLNSPLASSLTPSVNAGEWLWSGVCDCTISGTLNPQLSLPTGTAVSPGPTPFTQDVLLPLAGTFSGAADGSRVNVGIPSDALHDQDLSLPPIDESVDLGGLGLVTLTYHIDTLVLADISSSIVYRNATPIPEPGTAFLLAVGLVGLARRRRATARR